MEHLRALGLLTSGGRGAGGSGEVSGGGEQHQGFAEQNPQQPKENVFGAAFSWF